MQIRSVKPVLILLCTCFAFSCTKKAQFIETVSPTENPYLVQVDTFSGNFIITREDSFPTSSATYGLVGYHRDPDLGTTYAEHYSRFDLPTLPELDNTMKFDSLEMIIKLNHQYYGDTLTPMQLYIRQLTEPIYRENNTFYNTSRFAASATSLGVFKGTIRPQGEDSIRVMLDPQFGEELFSLIKSKATQVSSNDRFQEFFQGIRMSADSNQTKYLLGMKDTLKMVLHYHEDVGNINLKTINFISTGTPYRFNYIARNYGNSPLAPLNTAKELNASNTNNRFFLQEFTYLRTRIEFPSLKDILKLSDYVKILNAQLEVKPDNTTPAIYPLPASLNCYLRRSDQTLSGALANADGSTQDGSLYLDQLYGTGTHYVFDVTSYLLSQINADNYNAQQLVLAGTSDNNNLRRLSGNAIGAANLRSRLIVSMLIYKNQ